MSDGIRSVFHQYIERVLDDTQLEIIRRSLHWTEGSNRVPCQLDAEFSIDSNGMAKVTIKGLKIGIAIPGWDAAVNVVGQMSLYSEDEPAKVPVPPPSQQIPPETAGAAAPAFAPVLSDTPTVSMGLTRTEPTIPETELEAPALGLVTDDEEETESVETPAQKRKREIEEKNEALLAQAEKTGAKLSPEAQAALKAKAES